MIIDKSLLFSESQIVTATAVSTHSVEVGKGDVGASPLELTVLSATDATGDGTLVVGLETGDTPDGDFTVLVESRALAAADLTAGASLLPIRTPRGAKRYLRLQYTVAGALSATLTAFLALDRADA